MAKQPPEIVVAPGWEEVRLPFHVGSGRTMYSGQEQAGIARFRYYFDRAANLLIGRLWFGMGCDGPPGFVHGGALAYAMDESMGSLAWMNHYPAVASKLEFQYWRMSPLEVDLHLETRLTATFKDRLEISSRVTLPSGEICVTSASHFAVLTRKQGEVFREVDKSGYLQNPAMRWSDD